MNRSAILSAVLVFLVGALTPVSATAAEPRVHLSAAADTALGHVVIKVQIFDLDEPARTIRVEANNGSVYGAAYNVACPRVSSGATGRTHACDVPMPELTEPGTYTVTVTRAVATPVVETVVVAPFIHEWWTAAEIRSLSVSPDTGAAGVDLRFTSVPETERPLRVEAWTDSDGDGALDTEAAVLACAPEGADIACTTGPDPLPALCVDDAFGPATCATGRHRYEFLANGNRTGLTYEAAFQQLSAYDAGARDGAADYASGTPLSEVLDLDTFVLGSSAVCRTADAPACREAGYYTAWMAAFAAAWPNSVRYVDVVRAGDTAAVSAAVAPLPTGDHGVHLDIVFGPVDDPSDRRSVSCGNGCTDLAIDGLTGGDYEFVLSVVNDHPEVTIQTIDGNTVVWGGGTLVQTAPQVVAPYPQSATARVTVDPETLLSQLDIDLLDVRTLSTPGATPFVMEEPSSAGSVSGTVTCVPVVEIARPRVTHTCTAPLEPAPAPAIYTVAIDTGSDLLVVDGVVVEAIAGWWTSPRAVVVDTDIFTGQTDLVIEFPDAPSDLMTVDLGLWADQDGDGTGDTSMGAVGCSRESGVLTCRVQGLPPVCSDGAFTSNCSGGEGYLLEYRGRAVPVTIPATFRQLSRYEEGAFFAHQDFAADTPYEVEDFVLESGAVCAESDESHCFDTAYYTTWMDLMVQSFTALAPEDFEVAVDGTTATVSVVAPSMPTGQHGVELRLVHVPPGGDAQTQVIECEPVTGCTPVTLMGLAPGEHQVELQLFDRHPRVTVTTHDGSEVTRGQEVIATVEHAPVVIDAVASEVRGVVSDSTGAPLSGVTVEARPVPNEPAPPEVAVARAPRAALLTMTHSTVTDVTGAYTLAVPAPGLYDVSFTDPWGRVSSFVAYAVRIGPDGAVLDVTLPPSVPLVPSGDGRGTDRSSDAATQTGLPATGGPASGALLAGLLMVLSGLGLLLGRRFMGTPRWNRADA